MGSDGFESWVPSKNQEREIGVCMPVLCGPNLFSLFRLV